MASVIAGPPPRLPSSSLASRESRNWTLFQEATKIAASRCADQRRQTATYKVQSTTGAPATLLAQWNPPERFAGPPRARATKLPCKVLGYLRENGKRNSWPMYEVLRSHWWAPSRYPLVGGISSLMMISLLQQAVMAEKNSSPPSGMSASRLALFVSCFAAEKPC